FSIWCPVTITSSDPSVVDVKVHDITQVPAPFATGLGTATLTVTVGPPSSQVSTQVPVTVTGVPVAAAYLGPNPLPRNSAKPVQFAYLSSSAFDARTLAPDSLSIGGQPPLPFGNGKLIHFVDRNGDGRPDGV